MRLDLQPFGWAVYADRLNRIHKGLEDPTPVLEEVSETLASIGRARFQTGGYGDFDALKQQTVKRYQRRDNRRMRAPGRRLGVYTGNLSRSLGKPVGPATVRKIYPAKGLLIWKTGKDVYYAGMGSRAKTWYQLRPAEKAEITATMNRYLFTGK